MNYVAIILLAAALLSACKCSPWDPRCGLDDEIDLKLEFKVDKENKDERSGA